MSYRQLFSRGAAVGVIGLLSLSVAGIGIATAANGGSLTLGHTNTATKTTTIKDGKGTPLSLVGQKSKPPLKVNSSKQVAHLNASLLGGKSATGLATSGSGSYFGPDVDRTLSSYTSPTLVASTTKLSPGTYFVTASAETKDENLSATLGVRCFVGKSADNAKAIEANGSDSFGTQAESETIVLKLTAPATLAEYCYSAGTDVAEVFGGGIFAIKVAHATIGTTAE